MKKPTKATFKSFVKNNAANLMIKCESSFDGMTDCVENNRNAAFRPVKPHQAGAFKVVDANEHTLGISGIWMVGGGRDYFKEYNENGMFGYECYNSCGNFIVAIETPSIRKAA